MEKTFILLRQTRKNILSICEGLSFTELTTIPKGFNNNILWNVVHVYVTEPLLIYTLSILESRVQKELTELYRKGTFPPKVAEVAMSEKEFGKVKDDFLKEIDRLEEDYNKGIFEKFRRYQTSFGVELTNVEDAILFNNVHENIHLGYTLALRKAILS